MISEFLSRCEPFEVAAILCLLIGVFTVFLVFLHTTIIDCCKIIYKSQKGESYDVGERTEIES